MAHAESHLAGLTPHSPEQPTPVLREIFSANLAAIDGAIRLAGEVTEKAELYARHREALADRLQTAMAQSLEGLTTRLQVEIAEIDRQTMILKGEIPPDPVPTASSASARRAAAPSHDPALYATPLTPASSTHTVAPVRPDSNRLPAAPAAQSPVVGSHPGVYSHPAPVAHARPKPLIMRTRLDYLREMGQLDRHGDQLLKDAHGMDPCILRCKMQILAAKARIVQDEFDDRLMQHDWVDEATMARHHFGRLSKIALEFLKPHGLFARGIKRDRVEDWDILIAASEAELRELENRNQQIEQQVRAAGGVLLPMGRQAAPNGPPPHMRVEAACTMVAENASEENIADLRESAAAYVAMSGHDDWLTHMLSPFQELLAQHEQQHAAHHEPEHALQGHPAHESHAAPAHHEAPEAAAPAEPAAEEEGDPFRDYFKGKKGVLVGGLRKPAYEDLIREHFGFSELSWEETKTGNTSVFPPLAEKIRDGNYDVVFIISRWAAGGASDVLKPAAEHAGVPYISITNPNAAAIGRAIEKQVEHVG